MAGVKFPAKVERNGVTLELNGAGVREKFFFDIYVAALYLEKRNSDARRILGNMGPWRMVMHFLFRKVSADRLANGWEKDFEANLDRNGLARMRERIDRFKALFPDLRRDDVVWLDYLPGKGLVVSINGKQVGLLEGRDFAATLLSIWLGEHPVGDRLKQELLGEKG